MIRRPLMKLILAALVASAPMVAFGAENGTGFYLLGTRGIGAGLTPPSGLYFQTDMYFYTGDLAGAKYLPTGGKLAAGVTGKAALVAPTVLWVAPEEVFGGRLGLSATMPFGWLKSSADLTLSGGLLGTRTGSVSDTVFTLGDPIVGGLLGWDAGNFHYQIGTAINIPIGDYQKGQLANVSFNRWAEDFYGAATYLDPATGWEVSGALGITLNGENPATNYDTGTELHFEGAIARHFSKQFDAGLVGYYYQQLSDDSGEGAKLGGFKGRVAAIGASVGYVVLVGETPVSTRLKYFHEFAARNRAEGDSLFATIAIPLSFTKPASE